ncbi:DUF1552 domain-containing protein [Verrucomicrobiales bacterium]|jgi:hypothetical protein|nr:DUF1552 domain-containing protein [Verrucomicrobiales bacterium]MDF1790067.1 DUF1552 domain-containing protein [Verrucomicrobiales bacterium]
MPLKLKRRSVLKGLAGVALPLPLLEAMGQTAAEETPKRFCGLYIANGMALPDPKHGIDEWSWFPRAAEDGKFVFGKSTEPLSPYREQLSFMGGLQHANGTKNDPHVCSDMWLTGAPLHDPEPGTYNTVGLDQVIARHTRDHCRRPSLVLSIDAGTGYTSRTATISYDRQGKPIPAENDPRRIFESLFKGNRGTLEAQRAQLRARMKLVDAVAENAKTLDRQLGQADRDKMDQYLTSLNEFETRLQASEKWLDIPLKKQNYTHLDLDATTDSDPHAYYRTMLDLIALAFDADITRSVTFMMSREDGMGISDTFPLKLGMSQTHHSMSHKKDPAGVTEWAKYDRFLSEQLAYFLKRMNEFQDNEGSVLDNTIVLYGSGASTTHKNTNLPTLLAGGARMGLKHGQFYEGGGQMTDMYLSILHSMGIGEASFGDSRGTLGNSIFAV